MNELEHFIKHGPQFNLKDPDIGDDSIITASGEILCSPDGSEVLNRGNSIDAFIRNNYTCPDVSDHEYISDDSLRGFIRKLDKEREEKTKAP